MNMSSPGPFTRGQQYDDLRDEIEDADGRCIAVVWVRTTKHEGKYVPSPCLRDDPTGIANAGLFAASHTLLDIVKRFCDHFPGEDGLAAAMSHGGMDSLLAEARIVVDDLS